MDVFEKKQYKNSAERMEAFENIFIEMDSIKINGKVAYHPLLSELKNIYIQAEKSAYKKA
jgi:hypothetical protein